MVWAAFEVEDYFKKKSITVLAEFVDVAYPPFPWFLCVVLDSLLKFPKSTGVYNLKLSFSLWLAELAPPPPVTWLLVLFRTFFVLLELKLI